MRRAGTSFQIAIAQEAEDLPSSGRMAVQCLCGRMALYAESLATSGIFKDPYQISATSATKCCARSGSWWTPFALDGWTREQAIKYFGRTRAIRRRHRSGSGPLHVGITGAGLQDWQLKSVSFGPMRRKNWDQRGSPRFPRRSPQEWRVAMSVLETHIKEWVTNAKAREQIMALIFPHRWFPRRSPAARLPAFPRDVGTGRATDLELMHAIQPKIPKRSRCCMIATRSSGADLRVIHNERGDDLLQEIFMDLEPGEKLLGQKGKPPAGLSRSPAAAPSRITQEAGLRPPGNVSKRKPARRTPGA